MRVWTWLGSVVGAAIVGLALVYLAEKTVMPTLLQTQNAENAAAAGETVRVYYEDENPNNLDVILLYRNICLEAFMLANPSINARDIEYGDELLLPTTSDCYNYDAYTNFGGVFSDGNPPRLKYYEDGEWLDEPYYSEEVVYTGLESVEAIAAEYNVCIDDLLADNILLQNFGLYNAFANTTSYDVFIPADAPPCELVTPTIISEPLPPQIIEVRSADLNPWYISHVWNICAEAIPNLYVDNFYFQFDRERLFTVTLPTDAPPCYNSLGQRLSYYDLQGNARQAPEYSSYEVYPAQPSERLEQIANLKNVCLLDLLRLNNFPEFPIDYGQAELFIPPSRSCPDDLEARQLSAEAGTLLDASMAFNVCLEDLTDLNPQFSQTYQNSGVYRNNQIGNWVIVPLNAPTCYKVFHPTIGISIYDIERELNVCYEHLLSTGYLNGSQVVDQRTLFYIRHNAPPCYNAEGQRLTTRSIRNFNFGLEQNDLQYSPLRIHFFAPLDSVYTISQQYNVCVNTLITANPVLGSSTPTGYPVSIPNTRPCYDEATGMPLIYEDEAGNPFPQPRVADELRYYGSQPLGRMSYYYNVCINRIEAANEEKIERRAEGGFGAVAYSREELGWVIPTDRPPCYDEDGYTIDYVCYRQPMDFSFDYSAIAEKVTFDRDGSHCYDLADPTTRIVYNNEMYQLVRYNSGLTFIPSFTAWCYGVSVDEIVAVNSQPDVEALLPPLTRAIPPATRACYLDDPSLLQNAEVYEVQRDDLLTSIAARTGVPWWEIAAANDITAPYTIWPRQMLIIPNA